LFYCLSAKYKLEKLNDNNEDKEFINNFVASFLHPYITGQITKETDSKDRKPMIELLQEKMPGFESSKMGEVEEMALNAFFEKAALGLYVNQERRTLSGRALSGDITSKSPEFEILVNALTEALPREFPSRKISVQNLRKKASEAVDVVNEERKLAQEEAFNFKAEGDSNLRYAKLKQLKESGKLFLV